MIIWNYVLLLFFFKFRHGSFWAVLCILRLHFLLHATLKHRKINARNKSCRKLCNCLVMYWKRDWYYRFFNLLSFQFLLFFFFYFLICYFHFELDCKLTYSLFFFPFNPNVLIYRLLQLIQNTFSIFLFG